MPQGGQRTQSQGGARREDKKQARSSSENRGASQRENRHELSERPSIHGGDASVPDKPKREGRSDAEARTADQARGDEGARQARHAEAERKLGQVPEQENEEQDEE